ncbi:hypothetical protein PVAND_014566 [Polypedilum vanderplanki]|uniref:cystathionine gamma-lyase n=1 Tax=Polypedilum vanderplanki TaxID=319348 RepID=A0A9J6B9S4_POLVA|nr:hypothetical protein PVAND_014566 [Polypedilum vanderplanki]
MNAADIIAEYTEPPFAEKLGFLKNPSSFATKAIHTGENSNQLECSSIIPLINLTSTYKLEEAHNPYGYQYSRFGNPTRNGLETCLAALENSKFAITFSSRLGAQTAVISSLKRGEGILVDCDANSSCMKLFKNFAKSMEMNVKFVDFNNFEEFKNFLNENIKLIWFETPSSETMKIIDIKKISSFVKENFSNAKIVVDNTILTSYLQRPLEFGADIVIYSITKYLHGHSDVTMGSLAINDEKIHEKLKYHQGAMGVIPSPFDCFMVNRSLKTLALRMDLHMKNSFIVAKYLENQSEVEKVFHPALKSHPQYEIAIKQSYGHSGVFTFKLKNNEKIEKFLKALKIFLQIESPCGSSMKCLISDENEEKCELKGLISVSIGLENIEDLIGDIKNALIEMKN